MFVNYAWGISFMKIESNKTAISERGWFPLNYDLLLDTKLCSTMMDEEKGEEERGKIILSYHASSNYVEINKSSPTLDIQYFLIPPITTQKLNIHNYMSTWYLDAIVAT